MVDILVEFEPYFLYFLSEPVTLALQPNNILQPGFTTGHPFSYRGGRTRQLKLPDANAVSILSIIALTNPAGGTIVVDSLAGFLLGSDKCSSASLNDKIVNFFPRLSTRVGFLLTI